MTRLSTLRVQLASLRRARALVRHAAAWSAASIALLWTLALLFAIDVRFEFGILERMILLALALAVVLWAARRFTWSYLRVRETDEDMALLVERRHQIDSDLIASLQFESRDAEKWGSRQLENAVIDYVAQVGRGINVFDGFSSADLWRRGGLLAASLLVALVVIALYPGHAWAFAQRLLLGSAHYPTDTQIEQIVVNRRLVLSRQAHGTQPLDARCAQGEPIAFLVECRGRLPQKGSARLTATGGSRARTELVLERLSLAARKERLKEAAGKLQAAVVDDSIDIAQPWRDELAALLRFDAPDVSAQVSAARSRGELDNAARLLATELAKWPAGATKSGLYAGQLDRLVDGVRYKLALGDAWTDSAKVTMIPLPIVQRRLTPTPPAYARGAEKTGPVTAPQMAVLEGTKIDVAIERINAKQLRSAWMTVRQGDSSQRLVFSPADEAGKVWQLASAKGSPLDRVTKDLSYEIQVIDADGLSLEAPLRGFIRIRADRPPTGGMEVVHKVVLPTAEPVIEYRASDDFAVGQVRLLVDVQRPDEEVAPSMPPGQSASSLGSSSAETTDAGGSQMESAVLEVYPAKVAAGGPLQSRIEGQYALKLAQLPLPEKLAKGDQLKLTLEIMDDRGEQPGHAFYSEPLVLEVSDESGVLAAISEADERSEERLTDIIKRQLGIGESP